MAVFRLAGGAVTAMNSNVVQILNSTILHNTASNGGGIYLNICNHTALNGNVFAYNRALKAGGAHWQTQCNGEMGVLCKRNIHLG